MIMIEVSSMSKVYVVTSGEYSDYRIRAVFLSHEKATEFSEAGGGEIEEWDADTWTREDGEFTFRFDLAGNIQEERFEPQGNNGPLGSSRICLAGLKDINIAVAGGDRERAVKVASEMYTRFRASLDDALRVTEFLDFNDRRYVASTVAGILSGLEEFNDNGSVHSEWVKQALKLTGTAVAV